MMRWPAIGVRLQLGADQARRRRWRATCVSLSAMVECRFAARFAEKMNRASGGTSEIACLRRTISQLGLEDTPGHAISRGWRHGGDSSGRHDQGVDGAGPEHHGKPGEQFPIVRDLTSKAEMRRRRVGSEQRLEDPEPGRRRKACGGSRSSTRFKKQYPYSKAKASAEELDASRKLIYGVAEKVANAASEGGFLGFRRDPGEFRRTGLPGRAAATRCNRSRSRGPDAYFAGRCRFARTMSLRGQSPAARCRRSAWRRRESRGVPGRRTPDRRGRPAGLCRRPSCAARLRSST